MDNALPYCPGFLFEGVSPSFRALIPEKIGVKSSTPSNISLKFNFQLHKLKNNLKVTVISTKFKGKKKIYFAAKNYKFN